MSDFFDLMLKPFAACLILTGMHVYLGLHVIQRGVIFVDLALAQMAALGATVGFLFGFHLHSTQCYLFALGFTIIGAAFFAISRHRKESVPQEAYIGILYAIASAASILILSKAPEGGEELKSLLVGHLLFVDWPEIYKMLGLYSLIGFLHWLIRRPVFLISANPDEAVRQNYNLIVWDFAFYGLFGFVVASSVEIAGVLLVFCFLIVPSVCAIYFAKTNTNRLLVGWLVGLITSIAGVAVSFFFDLPTGAAIVCTFGFSLMICRFFRRLAI